MKKGATLYVALHRNGAVDGFVYWRAVPRGVILISTQLLRGVLARIFFTGIGVTRTKDGEDQSQNKAALRQCGELLAGGGELIVFPEGTSSLGPRHLPFKSGAASLALEALARGVPLRIVPLGIHYERAWAFRSRVEIVVGGDISTEFATGLSDLGRLKEMKRRMTAGLESVGLNFATPEAQVEAEALACAATLGTSRTYFDSLKFLESGVPENLRSRWQELNVESASRGLLRHQGLPLFPTGPTSAYLLALALLGPVVLAGALCNLPPLLAGWLAGRRFADACNVVTLWRILAGMPVLVLWSAGLGLMLFLFLGWPWALAYVLLTLMALKSFYRVKKLAVSVWNGLVHHDLAERMIEFHRALLQAFPSP